MASGSLDLGDSLESLSDVLLLNPANNQVIVYDAVKKVWRNAFASGGGGGGGGLTEEQINSLINSSLSNYLTDTQIRSLITASADGTGLSEAEINTLINAKIGSFLTEAQINALISSSGGSGLTQAQVTALINTSLANYLTETQIESLISSSVGGGGGFTENQIIEFINTRLESSIGMMMQTLGTVGSTYNVSNTNSDTGIRIFGNGTKTLSESVLTALVGGDDVRVSITMRNTLRSYSGSPPIVKVIVEYLDADSTVVKTDTVTVSPDVESDYKAIVPSNTNFIRISYQVTTSGVDASGVIRVESELNTVGLIEEEIRNIVKEENTNLVSGLQTSIDTANTSITAIEANAITADERKKLGFVDEYNTSIDVQQPVNIQFSLRVTDVYASPWAKHGASFFVRVANSLQNEPIFVRYIDPAGEFQEYEIQATDAVRSDTEYFYYNPSFNTKIGEEITGHTKQTVESLVMIRGIEANKQAIANIPIISEEARDILRKISAVRVTNDDGFKAIHNAPLPNTYPVLAAEVGDNPPNQVNQFPIAPLTFTRHNFYHDITVAGNKLSSANKLIAVKVTQGDVGEGNNSKVLTVNGVTKLEILRGVLNTYWQRGDGRSEIENYIETIRTRAGTFRYTVPIGHVNNFEYEYAWHIDKPRQYTVRIYASPSNPITPPQYDNAENQNEIEINIPDITKDVQLTAQNIYFHGLDRPSYVVTVSYNASLGDIEVGVVQDKIYAHLYPAYFAITAPATRTVVSDSTTYPRIFDNASTYVNSTVHNILVAIYKKDNGKMAISGYVNNIYIPELEYPYQQEGNFDFSNFVIGDRDGFHFISDVQMFDIGTIPTEEQLRSTYAHFDQLGLGLWEDNIEELDSIDIVANEIRLVDPTTGVKRAIEHQEEIVVTLAGNTNLAILPTTDRFAGEPLRTKLGGFNTDLIDNFAAGSTIIALKEGYFYDIIWHIKRTAPVGSNSPTATDASILLSDDGTFETAEPSMGFDSSAIAHNNTDRQATLFTKVDLREATIPKYVRVVLMNPTDGTINVSIQDSYLEIKRY